MSKLSKPQIKAHQAACKLLAKDSLTLEEREFVIDNWQESATHINSAAGAFFTPLGLARDFSIEVSGGSLETGGIVDLCAGIGALSFESYWRAYPCKPRIVCIEKNPDYVAVGRKVLPEATWICGDVFDLPADLGKFTFAISNPPFGKGGPIKGVTLDLNVVAVASGLAEYGVFILPAMSVPFRLSGIRGYEEKQNAPYQRFHERTGITLGPNCGIDCDFYRDQWRGVAPSVEIALADFAAALEDAAAVAQAATPAPQPDLFGEAA